MAHRRKNNEKKRAVVLLSGGMDSATLLALARHQGFVCHALTFAYGQRHSREIQCAKQLVKAQGAGAHSTMELDFKALAKSSPLTGGQPIPKHRKPAVIASDVSPTYVPARNTIFLSFALALAESLNTQHIFIGVNAVDHGGYPDCRPEYIRAFERLANLATRSGVRGNKLAIHAPFVKKSKEQILRLGLKLGVDYSQTHSCFDPTRAGFSCGECDACILRREAFRKVGLDDPIMYVKRDGRRRTAQPKH